MSKPRQPGRPGVPDSAPPQPTVALLVRRHMKIGWWTLLLFLTLGIALEALHAFKVGSYLSVAHETRRLMWTLAHAHGALLGLIQLAFAFAVRTNPAWPARPRSIASAALNGATILMPAGFFLGGIHSKAGDPGLGIILLPIGALMLLIGVYLTARSTAHHEE